jgi:TPR repeat protein
MKPAPICSAFSIFMLLMPMSASAEPAPPTTDCDRYAARKLTRDQASPAVAFEKIDPQIALPACESAVQRYPESSRLRFQLARVKLRAGQFESAASLLRPLAAVDYAPALHQLGTMYLRGDGVEKDEKIAFDLFRWSAEEGDANGQYSLAIMYESGTGTKQDIELAHLWYSKSADQGFEEAIVGVARNVVSAVPTTPVAARGVGVVPGAIICPDYATLTLVIRFYSSDWERRSRAGVTKGQSKFLDGESSAPDLESYGCVLVAPGTLMALESNHVVPVVTVKLQGGRVVRGVTLPAMTGK